jgi:hypothetical protein
VKGPGNVLAVGGGMHGGMHPVLTLPARAARTESGLGDVLLTASYRFVEEDAARPRLGLTGKIKLGTADERDNLGTGENDYAAQRDLAKGPFFGHVGYRVLGDPPGVDFRDVFYGLAGVQFEASARTGLGFDLFAQQAAARGFSGQIELGAFVSHKLDRKTRWRGYTFVGLADGSPDWGVGMAVTFYR